MTCPNCGEDMAVGSWPFCKGGHGKPALAVIDDQIEGGPRLFDITHEGVWIESKSQWKREVDARKDELIHVDKHDSAFYAKQRRMKDERDRDERR